MQLGSADVSPTARTGHAVKGGGDGHRTRRQVLGAGAVLGTSLLLGALPPSRLPVQSTAPAVPVPSDGAQVLADARLLHDVAAAEALSPVMSARLLAYGAMAMAMAADGPDRLVRVLTSPPERLPRPPARIRAAEATAAAFSVLLPVVLGPTASAGLVRTAAAVRLRLDPTLADVDTASVRYGRELGTRLAALAAADGCQGVVRPPFLPGGGPGSWLAAGGVTPTDAWVSRTARPLVVAAGSCPAARPMPFDLSVRSAYRAQLEDLVALTTDLDATQQESATFWAAPRGPSATVAGLWHLMAAEEAVRRGATAPGAPGARTVLALVDVAVFDALLRCWDVKFATDRARPVQVVPSTGPRRSSWTPFLDTPPFPEHTSGHSTASGAAAEVLLSLLGVPDGGVEVAPADMGTSAPRPVRWFPGWVEAAREASLSRQLGGVHFRQACDDGLREGALVARRVLARQRWDRG